MPRPQFSRGNKRVSQLLMFDPRLLQRIRDIAEENSVSISAVVERALLLCEGCTTCDELEQIIHKNLVATLQPNTTPEKSPEMTRLDSLNWEELTGMDEKRRLVWMKKNKIGVFAEKDAEK